MKSTLDGHVHHTSPLLRLPILQLALRRMTAWNATTFSKNVSRYIADFWVAGHPAEMPKSVHPASMPLNLMKPAFLPLGLHERVQVEVDTMELASLPSEPLEKESCRPIMRCPPFMCLSAKVS